VKPKVGTRVVSNVKSGMLGTQTQSLSEDGEAPLLRSAHLSPFPCVAVPGRHGPSTENTSCWTRAPDWDENFEWWHLGIILAGIIVIVWAFSHIYFGTPLWTALIGCAILMLFLGFVTGFKPGNFCSTIRKYIEAQSKK